jgi:hypothetical protein
MDGALDLSNTSTLISILLFTGGITVLISSTIVNKNAVIATMLGNYVILVGLLFILGYLSSNKLVTATRAVLFSAVMLTVGIVMGSIYLLTKYTRSIAKGNIPYLSTFSFLSSLFVIFQMTSVMYYLKGITQTTEIKSFDAAKLYGFSLISFFLLTSMYISLNYYVTDG